MLAFTCSCDGTVAAVGGVGAGTDGDVAVGSGHPL